MATNKFSSCTPRYPVPPCRGIRKPQDKADKIRLRKEKERRRMERENLKTLDDIVAYYIKENKDIIENYLGGFSTLIDCVCGGFGNVYKQPKYKKNSHQYRLTDKTIEDAHDALLPLWEDGKGLDTFEQLMEKVTPIDVFGFGPLGKYDFAVRYGYSRGLRPEKFVYLHQGAANGAKILVAKGKLPKFAGRLPVADFPEPLRRLGALHIECLLCIYEGELERI